jgi:hypothetical protein
MDAGIIITVILQQNVLYLDASLELSVAPIMYVWNVIINVELALIKLI